MISYKVSGWNMKSENPILWEVLGHPIDQYWAVRKNERQSELNKWLLDHLPTGYLVSGFRFRRQAVFVGHELTRYLGDKLAGKDQKKFYSISLKNNNLIGRWIGHVEYFDYRKTIDDFGKATEKVKS